MVGRPTTVCTRASTYSKGSGGTPRQVAARTLEPRCGAGWQAHPSTPLPPPLRLARRRLAFDRQAFRPAHTRDAAAAPMAGKSPERQPHHPRPSSRPSLPTKTRRVPMAPGQCRGQKMAGRSSCGCLFSAASPRPPYSQTPLAQPWRLESSQNSSEAKALGAGVACLMKSSIMQCRLSYSGLPDVRRHRSLRVVTIVAAHGRQLAHVRVLHSLLRRLGVVSAY